MQAYDDLKHFETPYVVKLHRFTPLAETQEVFTFHHPNAAATIDNSRSCSLKFKRQQQPSAICHGFAGYFDAELYNKVRSPMNCDCCAPLMPEGAIPRSVMAYFCFCALLALNGLVLESTK